MNIKLTEINFSITPKNGRCCLDAYAKWVESKVTRVGEGEDAEELFIGEVEVGTVIHCDHCGADFLLNEQGAFEWVDPDLYDLVDADETGKEIPAGTWVNDGGEIRVVQQPQPLNK